jgi:hypothetical protein
MELAVISNGGWGTNQFSDVTNMSAAAKAAWKQFTGLTCIILAQGQNDGGSNSKAAYKANLQAQIDQWRAVDSSIIVILVPPLLLFALNLQRHLRLQ